MWDLIVLNPMINGLLFIYDILGDNFGLAIIVLTAVIRLITFPLTYQQQRSTQKMQELQGSKRAKDIERKHKGDKTKQQEELLKLYREEGVNPLSGCLPLLIQFPVIIGLYQSIIRALADAPLQLFELSKHIYPAIRSSLIPMNSQFLWMDLAQPERLVIPGIPIGIPVLTILVVVTTYLSTKLTTPPTGDSQGSQMTQMMSLYMPLLLGYFAYTFAAGLALYFVVSNLLQVVQYAATGRVDWRGLLPGGSQAST
ncbi:MAG: YidC/Oxa1 family membrane protein insertase [Anaerolineales bacterium]